VQHTGQFHARKPAERNWFLQNTSPFENYGIYCNAYFRKPMSALKSKVLQRFSSAFDANGPAQSVSDVFVSLY
jgi:hypothetical protein